MPEKPSFPANEGDRPVGWQALRRGWNTNRVSAFPGGSQTNELSTGTSYDPHRKSPPMKTTSTEPLRHGPHRTTSAEPCKPHTPLQGTSSTEKSYTPLHRTSSVQPIRATAQLCRTNSSSQPSHTQSSSAVTTIIPQNKAGFSSITISSRKVSRSASLPGSDTQNQSSQSPSPPMAHQTRDPNSRQVTVQRKATIVKVTEQRMMTSPGPSRKSPGAPPDSNALDTVVHRRKATIIKVTEHRESYSPAKVGSGTRHAHYRHSYTDGLYKGNSMWSQGNVSQHNAAPSYHHLDSRKLCCSTKWIHFRRGQKWWSATQVHAEPLCEHPPSHSSTRSLRGPSEGCWKEIGQAAQTTELLWQCVRTHWAKQGECDSTDCQEIELWACTWDQYQPCEPRQ